MKFTKVVFRLLMVSVLCCAIPLFSMQRVKKMMGQMQGKPEEVDPAEGTKDIWDAIRRKKAVKYWLDRVGIEVKDKDGNTPLIYASLYCTGLPIVKFLIAHGADIEAKNNEGKTALISVAEAAAAFGKLDSLLCGFFDTVNYLIGQGANVEARDAEGNTILMGFAGFGNLGFVKTLVAGHANVEAQNQMGYTALMIAAERGHLDIVKYLVEQKAKIEAQNISGDTALRLAARKGKLSVVKYLLKQQAKIEDFSLMDLVFKYHDLELYQFLLDKGFDLRQRNEQGENLLMRALARGDLKWVSFLIEMGIDPYQKANKGFNAFDYIKGEDDTEKAIRRLQHIKRAMNPELPKIAEEEVKTVAADLPQQTGLTPTEAHWKQFGKEIEEIYGKVLEDPLVQRILAREKDAIAQGKYVFYRAEPGKYRVYQDFLEELYRLVYLDNKKREFVWNRFFKDAAKELTINEYIDTMQPQAHKRGPEFNVLLSANISLFGNIHNRGDRTWDYFLKNREATGQIELRQMFKRIFGKYGFDKKYIDRLLVLHKGPLEKAATLQQIIIPKNIVDDVVMFATSGYCFPWEDQVDKGQDDSCWDDNAISVDLYGEPKKGRYTCISSIIDKYRDGRIEIDDKMQVRILMNAVHGLNPDSGIEIYQYTRLPENELLQFKNEVKRITDEMFAEWLKEQLSKKEVPQSVEDEELGRVLKHLGKGKVKSKL